MPRPNPTPTSTPPATPPPPTAAAEHPPLPPGWVWTTLGEVTVPVEKTNPREAPEWDFVYLDISSIDNKTNQITSPKHYQGRNAPSRARQLVRAGDVLFSTVRVYLRNIALVPPQYDGQVASTGFAVLRSNGSVLPKFLFYYTLSDGFIQRLSRFQRGTSYPAVREQDVREQPFPLAPLPEQRRIVARIEELFSQLDAAEEGLRRVQCNLKRYRAAVLKAAVEGRLVPRRGVAALRPDETGEALLQRILAERRRQWEEQEWAKLVEKAKKKAAQARRKAQGLPARLKDIPPEEWQAIPEAEYRRYLPKDDRWKQKYREPTPPDTANLPPLPEGWVWATVEMVSSSIQYGYTQRAQPHPVGPRFLRITDIQDGEVDWSKVPYCISPPSKMTQKFALRVGDIVFARTGATTGKSYLIRHLPEETLFASYLIRVRSLPGILPEYLAVYFETPLYWRHIATMQKGMAQPGVNASLLARLPVPLPPLTEQRRIVAEVERRLSVAREAEKSVEANLKRIARLRQAILKRAFEGRLV